MKIYRTLTICGVGGGTVAPNAMRTHRPTSGQWEEIEIAGVELIRAEQHWHIISLWGEQWKVYHLEGFYEGSDTCFQIQSYPEGFNRQDYTIRCEPENFPVALKAEMQAVSGTISSSQMFNFRTVALMQGFGFEHVRSEEGDTFHSCKVQDPYAPKGAPKGNLIPSRIDEVFEGWEPSADGSRLEDWSQLGDSDSVHYRRRYVRAFRFTTPAGHQNVVAFSCSPHQSEELHEIVGLSSARDWDRLVESKPKDDDSGVTEWLQKFEVKL